MSKKYSTSTTLIIVESPAKCKKIEEYLGPGYKCLASYGHLREIHSIKNIDIENNFTPTYTIIDNPIKKKQFELLKKEIKKAFEVIIASDNDREGEAIGFSIIELFKLPLNTKRITFNEITEKAIQNSILNPKTINMDLVNAQKARQILDILVGFKISPILWKLIAQNKNNALSAGRCQTPALRLIYDNKRDITNIEEKKVYNTTGYFTNLNIAFELNKQYETEDDITDFLDGSIEYSHIYNCSEPFKIFKTPPEPFTTSRLQQVASNELHYPPKETMRVCQILYEAGYITYMRTDSKMYSEEFVNTAKEYIVRTYEAKYINENIDSLVIGYTPILSSNINADNNKKIKSKKAKITEKPAPQEAHEAIRPTNIFLSTLPETLDSKERRMYKLIWENTLESCISPASFYSITATISAFQKNQFTYKSEMVDFPGWKIVTKKYSTENKEYHYLQQIKKNTPISYKKMLARVTIKGSKHHYTEAKLVQLLEEKGIGRPSTFSSLVDKIQERGYVKKEDVKGREIVCKDFELENDNIFEIETKREFGNEKGKLIIQPLGLVVIELLEKHFDDLFNYNYTSLMEENLDKISKGEKIWSDLCHDCNTQIDILVNNVKDQTKMEVKIDDNNTYILGKYGPVIKCIEEVDGKEEITFKPIKKDININNIENGTYTAQDIIDETKSTKSQYILGKHDGEDVVLKKGKFGLYISWGKNSKTLKELGNRPIENITFEEIQKYLDEGSNLIREINSAISIRKGPKGDYVFYKNTKMKKPSFYDISKFIQETKNDYKICDINMIKSWINEKYNI
jgi:DNA topoisomerase-1